MKNSLSRIIVLYKIGKIFCKVVCYFAIQNPKMPFLFENVLLKYGIKR